MGEQTFWESFKAESDNVVALHPKALDRYVRAGFTISLPHH